MIRGKWSSLLHGKHDSKIGAYKWEDSQISGQMEQGLAVEFKHKKYFFSCLY